MIQAIARQSGRQYYNFKMLCYMRMLRAVLPLPLPLQSLNEKLRIHWGNILFLSTRNLGRRSFLRLGFSSVLWLLILLKTWAIFKLTGNIFLLTVTGRFFPRVSIFFRQSSNLNLGYNRYAQCSNFFNTKSKSSFSWPFPVIIIQLITVTVSDNVKTL